VRLRVGWRHCLLALVGPMTALFALEIVLPSEFVLLGVGNFPVSFGRLHDSATRRSRLLGFFEQYV
jgi:hypothetical protein